ncbi:alpha/beta hydrolase family protein [Amycolatopsis magusensis]|uniref:alpha/beta hydrolase family protein n=1 Tax=Amycolatopsis magusensis TaxID=882444 RepID=UPI003C2D830D
MRKRLTGAALALALSAAAFAAPAAGAQQNPYERGPAPTNSSIEATTGPFATSESSVSSLVTGFGGGTVYYPTSTSQGTYGALAISPGFTATQSSISWMGRRLASQGFVVITIDTNTIYDQPASRGDQLLAALDYLTQDSPTTVRSKIDPTRLAVAGHSMGGGGSLEASVKRPSLQAAIPLAPWNSDKSWNTDQVPTFIVGGESDSVAPVSSHAEPFYTSLSSAPDKAYLELNNASHFFPNTPNTTQAKYMISWLKRFVDNDTRYEQFLCPGPSKSTLVEEFRSTCPNS